MKIILYRLFLVVFSLGIGALLFVAMIYAGDKSKGPLEDLFVKINSAISGFEKEMITAEDSRASSLKWFSRYRNNVSLLNAPDTVFFGAYDDQTINSFKNIVTLEDSLGFQLPIIQIYSAWGSKVDQNFPLLRAEAIYDLGSVPMITWEPWLDDFDPEEYPFAAKDGNINEGGLKAISQGLFDEYIDNWALDVKEFRHPLFLRFAHEMNDPYRYPWGPQNNSPEEFKAAWNYLADRFDSIGVSNVIWVWSPHPAYPYTDYFPERNVDWIGITALNYGTVAPWSQWWTFDETFSKCYNELSGYNIPFMITEFASLGVGGDRPKWYYDALKSVPEKYPLVHAMLFFHAAKDNTTTYKSLDWTLWNDQPTIEKINEALDTWK
ncbi:MAG: glycosyl hydrolase [Cyclobacteriaceae bacterium]|nr:glycosyl hydrolase [Cyclobacteriaceae bacterium]